MPPFRYESQTDPRYIGTIADLMLRGPQARAAAAERIGQIQAQGAQQEGAAWSGAVQNIGQLVSNIPAQIQQQKRAALQDQMGALQLHGAQESANDDAVFRHALAVSGGDLSKAIGIAQSQGAAGVGALQKLIPMAKAQQDQHDEAIGEIGYRLHQAGNTPDAVKAVLSDAVSNGAIPAADAQKYYLMSVEQPDKIKDVSRALMAQSRTFRPELDKTFTVKNGEEVRSVFDPSQVLAKSEPRDNEIEVAKRAAAGDPLAIAVMNRLKPAPARTAEQDKAEYLGIVAKKNLGQPLTPEEQAKVGAYEQEKTLGVDKSASAAADRQTAALGAQVGQQKRAQDFAALQAARADLEKNVNTPYNTAKTSANTLRDVVEAAKNGNTVAASLQALEGTMAAIRAQGLNRINTAEIGATADAGSLFQNIAGWVGKKAEGQPVPASVQKDMLEFATILEKAAHKKYQAGHKAVNALYGTNIPELLTGPEGSPAAPGTLTPGLASLAGRK